MLRNLRNIVLAIALMVTASYNADAGESLYGVVTYSDQSEGDIRLNASVEGSRIYLNWDFEDIKNVEEVIIERAENEQGFQELFSLTEKQIGLKYTDYLNSRDLEASKLSYRVTVITRDGKSVSSNAAVIDLDSTKHLKPNIIVNGGELVVDFISKYSDRAEISIFNNTGQPLKSQSLLTRKGDNNERIDANELRSGLYFLRIEMRGEVTTTKFFVR